MSAAPDTAGLSSQPAPAQDRCDKPVPARVAEVLAVLTVLTGYGRHLAETLEHRAVSRGFATIARFFGTVAFDTILAHIMRGLMRALALERVLLRRAARGRDLAVPAPSGRRTTAEAAADSEPAAGPAVSAVLTPEPGAAALARPARVSGESRSLTLDSLPSMEEIEAQVRRSPVGRTIAAICRDLGISPSLCEGGFWNRLFDAVRLYRGNIGKLVLDVKRREQRFGKDEWKHPELELPEQSREAVRRVLGFFIGEPPVDPLSVAAAPVVAAATGPP
jgi:hypothetical protein